MSDGKTIYIESNTGISGDMFVAALLDLGADREVLTKALDSLKGHHVDGFDVKVSRVFKAGIEACDFNVILDAAHDAHDHDMEYLHGHEHGADIGYSHTHSHSEHEHGHGDSEGHGHAHSHEHRYLADIVHIIEHADITPGAGELAIRIFDIVAEAESKAHGLPKNEVHFHEVGAVDSIVDIIAAAVCFDNLNIERVIIPSLTEGTGTVRCQHGVLPIPVPAVSNIVTAHNLNLRIGSIKGELVTPTGAAIAAAIITTDRLPESLKIKKIGIGAGKREYEVPSMLRIMEIEESDTETDTIWKIETDIDDSTGEELGFVIDKLYEIGAREVHFIPIYMKKNRPGYELVVITDDNHLESIENTIFTHTTTIGLRKQRMERAVLRRFQEIVTTEYGRVDVKTVVLPDGSIRRYPEFTSMRALAEANNVSIRDIRTSVEKSV